MRSVLVGGGGGISQLRSSSRAKDHPGREGPPWGNAPYVTTMELATSSPRPRTWWYFDSGSQ